MDETVSAVELGGNTADFSVLGMFAQADIVVQSVMVLLLAASLWGWSIIFNTAGRLKTARGRADLFEDSFWSGNSIDDLYQGLKSAPDHPMAAVFVAAMREWQRSLSGRVGTLDKITVQDRIQRIMNVTMQREMDRMEGQVGYLATIGSAAPFVGLFGTVWGIMNSFQSIALASDTSLATVAPGIAEALLATALGLVAAIPAVVAYNKLSGDLGRFAGRVEGFADEFAAILSRQLDERAA
ncbi:protein TolQ [Eilatimonas milleporae]|uniref:Tol-Pal system protein TolQ n=1 Tax=Eilatimonas milleporae TaxID=911205 RepID=A0A3M0CXF5_9PROT|nr:protein TolQ [Eilatimonas milleporae]RMB12186.1 cell division and transport-associated protein TolQ [Eilatimonas milleporae]